jgi:lipid II:glycine glycyltransferase (peptidoglycan interpeptide bridge formation enzyme)
VGGNPLARERGIRYYNMVAGPRPENLDEKDPLWCVYRLNVGFGGEITNFLGCLDLPLKGVCAAAWYR